MEAASKGWPPSGQCWSRSRQHASIWHSNGTCGNDLAARSLRGKQTQADNEKDTKGLGWPGYPLWWSQPHLSLHAFLGTTPLYPKESCICTQSAFFCVLGQWKWITGLAGISPKVGTQPSWSTDGVRSGFFPYKQEKPCGFRIIWNVFLQNEDWLDAWSSPETMLIVLAACTPQEPIHKKKIPHFKIYFFKTLCSWKKKLIE